MQAICSLFDHVVAEDILDAPLVGEVVEDNLIWKEEQDGKYNVKSGYRLWREVQENQRERKVEGD